MDKLRNRLENLFSALGRWTFRRRYLALLLMALVVGAFLSQIPKIRMDTSNESFFHKDDPTLEAYDRFRSQFGREEYVIIGIEPPTVFDRAFLNKLKAFHEALENEVPYLADITSLVNIRDTRGEGNELIVEDLLENMPTSAEDMARFRKRVLGSELYPNFLISEQGDFTTVIIETLAHSPGKDGEADLTAGFSDSEAPVQDVKRPPLTPEENAAIVTAVKKVIERFEGPDFPTRLAGWPVIDVFFDQAMQRDMGLFSGLAILSIAVFLMLLFRRVSGVVLPVGVVLLSLLSTVGLMAATDTPFTIPTNILPSFLLAVSVGMSVHLLAIFYRHFQATGNKEEAIVYAMGHSGLPIFMTAITTSAGLFAFSTAEMAPVAHLGIFAGSGVLIALVYTTVLLPALLAVWPLRARPVLSRNKGGALMERILEGVARFSTERAWAIVIVSGVLGIAAVVGLTRLSFSMNFISWIPESLEIRQNIDRIDEKLKGSVNLEVVIDTDKENGLYEPAVINGMETLSGYGLAYRSHEGQALVAKTTSVADVLKETNRALNENRQDFYAVPQQRKLIAQELLLFENSGSDDLENLVDSQFSKARLSLHVPNGDAATYVGFVADVKQQAEVLRQAGADVTVTGTLNLWTQMIFQMMRSMMNSYLIAGVVISIMMMLLIGSVRIGALSMVANFAPILLTMGLLMGFTGIPLDAFTLLIGSIALGLAVDDTIHFFHNFRRYYGQTGDVHEAVRQTLLTSGQAMLITTLVLVTGFWLFMFATLNNVFRFGLLTGTTLILALLADFLLAPALLTLVTRTRFGRQVALRWGRGEPET